MNAVMKVPKAIWRTVYLLLSICLLVQLFHRYERWQRRVERVSPEQAPFCASGELYTVQTGDSCNSISLAHKIPSYGLYAGNREAIVACDRMRPGMALCLPFSCAEVYAIQPGDTCKGIEEQSSDVLDGEPFTKYNSWLHPFGDCDRLIHINHDYIGSVFCLGPQAGVFEGSENVTNPVSLKVNPEGYNGRQASRLPGQKPLRLLFALNDKDARQGTRAV
ncbi:hypothetical protein FE257_001776 [Aspergillus nanangensis]|uniref:LysM domain-containing protein n=1 Tax=Aspergillus nanangensis TaxID=2582783 RepID=A0AAD4CDG0_ASPNN|nr:hypothetical protein FE257_001776 [Aspergillus nanangensis]